MTQSAILGHPSCPKAMLAIPEQLRDMERTTPLRITLPPVTPGLEPCLDRILLLAVFHNDVEIIANDWGALFRLAQWKRTCPHPTRLILGVLLSGQDTDPVLRSFTLPQPDRAVWAGEETVLLRWAPPPPSLSRHWSEPACFHLMPLLREMGVDAVELGLQPLPLPPGDGLLPIVPFPYGVLSVKPCRGKCASCAGPDTVRAGCRLFFDRNLLLWQPVGNRDKEKEGPSR